MSDKENINLGHDHSSETHTSPARRALTMTSPFKANSDLSALSTPKKNASTRVIESLHAEIDDLKSELIKVKNRNQELNKANEIIKKRRDQLVEQISNVKHENDTINSLLDRKQRRITDLESQLSESLGSTDDLNFRVKTLEQRCSKLQDAEMSALSEVERLKTAYETIIESQKDVRKHYYLELKSLRDKLIKFTEQKDTEISRNIGLINKSDATIYRSIKSIAIRSNEIEEKYEHRDQKFLQMMKKFEEVTVENNKEMQAIIDVSKVVFEQIAEKMGVGYEELLEKYLQESHDKANPFGEIKAQDVEGVHTHEDRLSVKKRSEKKPSNTDEPIEQRMFSLGKELNSSIPITHRSIKAEFPLKLQKPSKKGNASSPMNSRRTSRIIEDPIPFRPTQRVASTQINDDREEAQKKRRRRRRKRRSSKKDTETDECSDGDSN